MTKQLSVDAIRGELERMILAGELAPGQRLNELALAARFRTSRTVLRQAARALEEARLVEVVPNRGAIVRTLGLADALELFEVRAGLARAAGRLAALRAARPQIDTLRKLHRSMKQAASAADIAAFQRLNLDFHAAMFDIAANPRLRELDRMVRNEMQLYIRENVASEARMRISLNEHEAIVTALEEGDGEACSDVFERHILNGKKRLMDGAPAPVAAPRAPGSIRAHARAEPQPPQARARDRR